MNKQRDFPFISLFSRPY